MLMKVKIHDMLIMSSGKFQYGTCLAALTTTLDDQRLAVIALFPREHCIFNLSFEHTVLLFYK